jgi:hypothetical protein
MFGNTITPPIEVISAKAPFDRFSLPVDFSRVLPPNDTIAAIASVIADPADLTVSAVGIVAGERGADTAVAVALSGGSISRVALSGGSISRVALNDCSISRSIVHIYTVTIDITTTLGDQYSRSFKIGVQQR